MFSATVGEARRIKTSSGQLMKYRLAKNFSWETLLYEKKNYKMFVTLTKQFH